jgi:hypothetical protein
VSLTDFEPVVWRRVLVPDTIALPKLHRVIQQLMLWWDYHMHIFEVGDVRYGQPELDEDDDFNWRNERGVKIAQIVPVGSSFKYSYDFGDNWKLLIEVEAAFPVQFALKHPVCSGGEFAAPPEDVGGVGRFRQFLDALKDPNDEEHENYVHWSGGNYDFSRCDLAEINARLQQTPSSSALVMLAWT